MYYVLCIVNYVLCNVCTWRMVLCSVWTWRIVLCTVYWIRCTVFTWRIVMCTEYCVLSTMYCVYCVLCIAYWYCVLCVPRELYCLLCTVYCMSGLYLMAIIYPPPLRKVLKFFPVFADFLTVIWALKQVWQRGAFIYVLWGDFFLIIANIGTFSELFFWIWLMII